MYSKGSKLSEAEIKQFVKELGKDNVGIEAYKGKYRLVIARAYSRMHYGVEQKRPSTGLSVLDSKGKIDTANADVVSVKISQMHNDLANGYFDKTLVKYGLAETKLEVIDGGKQKQPSLLELYDIYCESRKGSVAETTLKLKFKGEYKRAITEAIDAAGENALAIRNWLVEHRNSKAAKDSLAYLSKTCQLGIKQGLRTDNPFDGMAEEIKLNKGSKTKQNNDNDDNDGNARAFSISEMNAIIEAFETPNRKHLAPIIKFLFWTGCRTGEAIAFKWHDVKWDNEFIVFRRTYNPKLKLFKSTKTEVIRYFPLPKNSELWNLLKSLPQGGLDDIVFKSKLGGVIYINQLFLIWKGNSNTNHPGVIPQLIKEGKVKEYLKLYATRHTFISHQVNIHKIPITTVAQWVGNGAMVSNNSYLDRDRMTVPGHSSDTVQPLDDTSDNSKPPEFLANLTPEQLEQLKAWLNK